MTEKEAQEEFYFFLHHKSGHFFSCLFEAFFCADSNNIKKLSSVFPEEYNVIKIYKEYPEQWEDIVYDIEEKYNLLSDEKIANRAMRELNGKT